MLDNVKLNITSKLKDGDEDLDNSTTRVNNSFDLK